MVETARQPLRDRQPEPLPMLTPRGRRPCLLGLNGAWWNPDSVTNAFRRAVKAAGVPLIRLQDVRHTHASLLLKAGVHPKVVSERLGHSSVAFTLDTYAHVMPGMQPDAAERFMKIVLGDATAEPEQDGGNAAEGGD